MTMARAVQAGAVPPEAASGFWLFSAVVSLRRL